MGRQHDIWRKPLFRRKWKAGRKETPWKLILLIIGIFLLAFMAAQWVGTETIVENNTVIEIEEKIIKEEVARPLFRVTASDPTIIGRYGNNIQWYGRELKEVNGSALINLDLTESFGQIVVELNDTELFPEEGAKLKGDFRFEFSKFEGTRNYQKDGVVTDLYLFGTTGREGNHLPETKAFVSAWGRVNVFMDGQLLYTDLVGHFLMSEGIRRTSGAIANDEGIVYQHQDAAELGYVDPEDRELHFFVYSVDQDPKNFPGREVFVNILFEEFEIESKPKELKV